MAYNPPLIFGPIAPENNPPIEPQFYKPSVFQISAISLGTTTTVTTSVDHNYVVGQLVRLLIPQPNGSFQLNELTAYVISIPTTNEVILDLDSTYASPFVASSPSDQFVPLIVAAGDINTGAINTGRSNNQTFIDGSFINISP